MSAMERLQARQKAQGTRSPTSLIDLLDSPPLATEANKDGVQQIAVDKLHDFSAHTFEIREDETYQALAASVAATGVRLPLLVRPYPKIGEFEIISGHRRLRAARSAELETVPCLVVSLDDDDATILMAESNIQRPDWLPSEKAKTYALWLSAVQKKSGVSQGTRSDLNNPVATSATGLPKSAVTPSATPSTQLSGEGDNTTPTSATQLPELELNRRNRDIAASKWGISGFTFSMYLKLNNLLPDLLDLVDENKIGVKAGYQLAFLPHIQQQMVLDFIADSGNKISPPKAEEIRKAGDGLTVKYLEQLFETVKATGKVSLSFSSDVLLNKKTIKAAMSNATVMEKIEEIIKTFAHDHNLPLT